MKTNLDFYPIDDKDFYFHSGFYNQAQNLVAHLKSYIGPNQNVVFTGHSMGAAVSSICTYLYGNNSRAFCFSTPACCSSNFSVKYQNQITSVINDGDLIPLLSTHALTVMLNRVQLLKAARNANEVQLEPKGSKLEESLPLLGRDINPSSKNLSIMQAEKNSLFVPGKILFVEKGQIREVNYHEIGELQANIVMGIQHFAENEMLDALK
ncbi:Lipase_class 3 family protein [Hexamita inflata]|uniref:sn-1-specific diacylglycerol lipase n=1 Tax=Hexamita inflata TaxID=28002 RepID=A0AA86UP13_9EUKA|nr:Lipase class 3 family protein [Hexamita inflata]